MFRTAWTRVPEVQARICSSPPSIYEREHGDSTGFVRMLCEASTVVTTRSSGVRYLPVGDLVAFDGNPRSSDVERITRA